MNKCSQCLTKDAKGKFCSKKCADKNYTIRTKDQKREYDKIRHLENSDKNIKRAKVWRDANKNERWDKEKAILENSFEKRFYKSALTIIKTCYRTGSKANNSKTFEKLGFTISELTNRLLETLPNGFSFQDYISGILHLDHIKPHCYFKYDSHLDIGFKECWSLNNLQLLEANKNIRKQKSYEPTTERLPA